MDPPNHTAYLCMWWVMTCTSIGLGWKKQAVSYTSLVTRGRNQGKCTKEINREVALKSAHRNWVELTLVETLLGYWLWRSPDAHLQLASAQLLTHLQPGINRPLQVPLQTTAKVPEHGGASRQDDVLQTSERVWNSSRVRLDHRWRQRPRGFTASTHLVERTSDINGAVLNDFIHHFRDGLGEVRVGKLGLSGDKGHMLHCAAAFRQQISHVGAFRTDGKGLSDGVSGITPYIVWFWTVLTDLRVEEDLRPQEALVAHIDGELLLADGVDAGVLLNPLGAVRVVLVELFNQIRAHVAEAFLREETETQLSSPWKK